MEWSTSLVEEDPKGQLCLRLVSARQELNQSPVKETHSTIQILTIHMLGVHASAKVETSRTNKIRQFASVQQE